MCSLTRAYCGSAPLAETSAIQSPWISAAGLRLAATNRIQMGVTFIPLLLSERGVLADLATGRGRSAGRGRERPIDWTGYSEVYRIRHGCVTTWILSWSSPKLTDDKASLALCRMHVHPVGQTIVFCRLPGSHQRKRQTTDNDGLSHDQPEHDANLSNGRWRR